MQTIIVKLTNESNAKNFSVKCNDTVVLPIDEYLIGVVAAEIGNAPIEACKAQAVAARTFAYPFFSKDKVISDSSSTAQAFNAQRLSAADTQYPNVVRAVQMTQGEVLTYNGAVITTCSYCDSNGGQTVSAKERWGSERAWLIAKHDPWDEAAGKKRNGHGVGMSQAGAKYAASIGKTYRQILSFYYTGTTISRKESGQMANTVDASKVVQKFQYALSNKWGYIASTAGEVWTQNKQNAATNSMTKQYGSKWIGRYVADCSGLFYWAYKQLGGYMYHGSNTMWRKYCTKKGKINEIDLVPGMAVFKHKNDGQEPASFKKDGQGNFYHVGLYIGNGYVIEAKGTATGVVKSKVSEWSHAARLINTRYDDTVSTDKPTGTIPEDSIPVSNTAVVTVDKLNLRKAPSTKGSRIAYLNTGDVVTILKTDCGTAGWYYVKTKQWTGYVMAQYLKKG